MTLSVSSLQLIHAAGRTAVKQLLVACALTVAMTPSVALAQTGGGFDLTWSTVDGGGATFSTGGSFTVGGTIGQPDAGAANGGGIHLVAGFWGGGGGQIPAGTPTNTPSIPLSTPTRTATLAHTATATRTGTVPPTRTASVTPTGTILDTATPTQAPPVTGTATATATATVSVDCVGDCELGGEVTVDEIITMVNIALGQAPATDCEAGDSNVDGQITVDEILQAVNNALSGCPGV